MVNHKNSATQTSKALLRPWKIRMKRDLCILKKRIKRRENKIKEMKMILRMQENAVNIYDPSLPFFISELLKNYKFAKGKEKYRLNYSENFKRICSELHSTSPEFYGKLRELTSNLIPCSRTFLSQH